MTEENKAPFKVFEHGLVWSASGFTTYTVHWSDGTITEEERVCVPSLVDIILRTPRIYG